MPSRTPPSQHGHAQVRGGFWRLLTPARHRLARHRDRPHQQGLPSIAGSQACTPVPLSPLTELSAPDLASRSCSARAVACLRTLRVAHGLLRMARLERLACDRSLSQTCATHRLRASPWCAGHLEPNQLRAPGRHAAQAERARGDLRHAHRDTLSPTLTKPNPKPKPKPKPMPKPKPKP